jgi:ribosomal protein S18 acetylase RimI-like enzyme
MIVRLATENDRPFVWAILSDILQEGETYSLPRNWSEEEALDYWYNGDHTAYVTEDDDGNIVGTYFIHLNQKGGGSHVCNCGYATAVASRHKGVARLMCNHSIELAKSLGYRAMQYNFVISSNTRAVELWKSFGFDIVGTLPQAFCSPTLGYVNVYVMYKNLL